MRAGCTFIDDWGLYIRRRLDIGTNIHRRQQDAHIHTHRGRTFIDDRGMDMHRTTDDVHSSSTTARKTFIDRQTDRQRSYIYRRQRDGYASNDTGRTFIDGRMMHIHRRRPWQLRHAAELRPSLRTLCWCGEREREREGESITRTRSAPISFAPISFASFAAAASSASKAHAQVSSSKIDMCSWILSSSSLSIHSLEPAPLHLFSPNCLQYVLPKRDLCFFPSCLHSFLVSIVAIVVCSPPSCR